MTVGQEEVKAVLEVVEEAAAGVKGALVGDLAEESRNTAEDRRDSCRH